jgi:hypothetical protein
VTAPIGYGLDLSSHQNPAALPWDSFRGHVDFVIVRANYGTRLDARAKEHVQRARDIGAKVGLYSFFRHDQSVADQYAALQTASFDCGIKTDDIVPALDIEDDESGHVPVAPSWSAPCETFVERAIRDFGDCLVYITQRGHSMLGKPEWVLHRPLWCAHYRDGSPATPGNMPATIHQHRVAHFVPNGPGGFVKPSDMPHGTIQLDQNRLLLPLPLVGYRPTTDDQERVRGLVAETLARGFREGAEHADTEPPEAPSTDPDELAPETPRLT